MHRSAHFRDMTDRENEDTIELQLSAEQLEVLTRAAEPEAQAAVADSPSFEMQLRAISLPVILSVLAFAGLLNGMRYATLAQEQDEIAIARPAAAAPVTPPSHAPDPEAPPATSRPPDAMRFANPFDKSEVFEFPPGTSEVEARDAVADLLLQRARDRVRSPPQQIRVAQPVSAQLTAR